jgi:hypothetical protein
VLWHDFEKQINDPCSGSSELQGSGGSVTYEEALAMLTLGAAIGYPFGLLEGVLGSKMVKWMWRKLRTFI